MQRKTTTAVLLGSIIALTCLGCDQVEPTAVSIVQEVETPQPEVIQPAPHNFSWVVDNQLAGMAHPGFGDAAETNYDYLASQNVSLLISLTETAADSHGLVNRCIGQLHFPVVDFSAPTLHQLDAFVTSTADEINWGGSVVVHCAAGQGRTGTFLAAWFVATGASAQEAIDHVRVLRPGSIETQSQIAIVEQYADLMQ